MEKVRADCVSCDFPIFAKVLLRRNRRTQENLKWLFDPDALGHSNAARLWYKSLLHNDDWYWDHKTSKIHWHVSLRDYFLEEIPQYWLQWYIY